MNPLLKRSDMARDSKGITQFYLAATHSRTIPAFTPKPQGITSLWVVLITPTHGGMARLSWPGWLVIYWDRFFGTGDWTPDTVTHLSTNRARRRLTSLIETNALTTTPNRQLTQLSGYCSFYVKFSREVHVTTTNNMQKDEWLFCGDICCVYRQYTADEACTAKNRRRFSYL